MPSLKVPDTVSCWVRPFATLAAGVVIDKEIRTGCRTVSTAAPRITPDDAVMVAAPGAAPMTKPREFTPAIEGSEEAQVTELVTSLALPSVNAAVAATCTLLPFGTEGPGGVMEIDISVAGGTVRVTLALTEPETASITVVPGSFATAVPDLSTDATSGLELVHVAVGVRSCLLPSEKMPVRAKRALSPIATTGLTGDIARDDNF